MLPRRLLALSIWLVALSAPALLAQTGVAPFGAGASRPGPGVTMPVAIERQAVDKGHVLDPLVESVARPTLTVEDQQLLAKLRTASTSTGPESLVPVLDQSLRDPNPEIRREGLQLILVRVTRAGALGVGGPIEWPDVQRVLLAQRSRVIDLLDDEDAPVRAAAVGAAAYLDYIRDNSPLVSAELANHLLNRFKRETDARVRRSIAMLFQMSAGTEPADVKAVVDQIVVAAMGDESGDVIMAALFGAGHRHITSLLSHVVARLKDSNRNNRMVAAESLAAYGALAKPYIPQLQAAAAIETDRITQQTMLGTLSSLSKQ